MKGRSRVPAGQVQLGRVARGGDPDRAGGVVEGGRVDQRWPLRPGAEGQHPDPRRAEEVAAAAVETHRSSVRFSPGGMIERPVFYGWVLVVALGITTIVSY